MVRHISGKVNDELYDETVAMAESIGLNRSQMVRYAFAIVCGYDKREAMIMAKVSPDVPFSTFTGCEQND